MNSLFFLNQRLDNLDPTEVLGHIRSSVRSNSYAYIVTPNIDHLLKLVQNAQSATELDYRGADLAICDSRIVKFLAGIVGKRVTVYPGSDIVKDLLSSKPDRRYRVSVVGPSEGDVALLASRYPDWQFQYCPAPMMQVNSPDFTTLVEKTAVGDWDILLICLGFPKQEAFAAALRRHGRRRGIALCVGASVDFLVGNQKRAPLVLQHAGLEWMHRLISDPRRLWRRYLFEGPRILYWYLKIEVYGERRQSKTTRPAA